MNKAYIIEIGLNITKNLKGAEFFEEFNAWKDRVLQYVEENNLSIETYKKALYVVDNPFESKEDKAFKYRKCINKTIDILQKDLRVLNENDSIDTLLNNFGIFLKGMFRTELEKKATIKSEILKQITIHNEYDIQHIMYALIKTLYPSARREVNQDIGYGTVRYDIIIEELDTIIEMKCTRDNHTDKKLFRELGEDAFFYKCSKLYIYIYDKKHKISDVVNFVKALERKKEEAGKEIKVYVEQSNELV